MTLFDFQKEESASSLVRIASTAYEAGTPILADHEFDLLADHGLSVESRNFRQKVQHPFPMGSLDKIKDTSSLKRWMPESRTPFAVMPKLDGCSIRLSYRDGILVQAVTRGDGWVGNDVTQNILCTNVVKDLGEPMTIDVRVEAAIKQCHASKFDKNLRNIASGMINAKDPRPELALVDCIVIDVFTGQPMSWWDKAFLLKKLFPKEMVVPIITINPFEGGFDFSRTFDWAKDIKEAWDRTLPYALDGVVLKVFPVLTAVLPVQDGLIPKNKIALKFGSPEAETVVESIDWSLGQHGKLTPVLNVKPVELDGTTVRRVSASNYALLKEAGMGLGAKVSVTKSGDIIPFVTKVHQESKTGLEVPCCPECGEQATLSISGVDALCINQDCNGNALVRLKKTVGLFGIDFVSDSTIEALFRAGFDTIEKLFELSESDLVALPGFGEKTAAYLVAALKSAQLTEAQVIKSAFLKGIGERKGKALLDHYGSIEDFIAGVMVSGLDEIEGFGPIQAKMINENAGVIADMLYVFNRLGVKIIPHEKTGGNVAQQIVCCTGTCSQYPRKELAIVLERKGFSMVDTVTKETTLLLCADPNGNSSKLTKARKQGILIQSYDEFFAS